MAHAADPTVLLDVPITFRAGDTLTHAPMIHAAVRGIQTKLILDTGATDHILTTDLAAQVGLEARPGESGTDSIGASVPSWTLGDIPIQVADQEFVLRNVIAITGPEPFEGWGIGGFVSAAPASDRLGRARPCGRTAHPGCRQ